VESVTRRERWLARVAARRSLVLTAKFLKREDFVFEKKAERFEPSVGKGRDWLEEVGDISSGESHIGGVGKGVVLELDDSYAYV